MRIDDELLKRLTIIAEENERSLAQEITYLIKQRLKEQDTKDTKK